MIKTIKSETRRVETLKKFELEAFGQKVIAFVRVLNDDEFNDFERDIEIENEDDLRTKISEEQFEELEDYLSEIEV
jgi:hypothetical protein